MPNSEILRCGPATPARQTVSSVCCTIMIGVSLCRPLGQTVTPAVRQSAPAKDRVAYCMTSHERYILQAIASQVEIRTHGRSRLSNADDFNYLWSISSEQLPVSDSITRLWFETCEGISLSCRDGSSLRGYIAGDGPCCATTTACSVTLARHIFLKLPPHQ